MATTSSMTQDNLPNDIANYKILQSGYPGMPGAGAGRLTSNIPTNSISKTSGLLMNTNTSYAAKNVMPSSTPTPLITSSVKQGPTTFPLGNDNSGARASIPTTFTTSAPGAYLNMGKSSTEMLHGSGTVVSTQFAHDHLGVPRTTAVAGTEHANIQPTASMINTQPPLTSITQRQLTGQNTYLSGSMSTTQNPAATPPVSYFVPAPNSSPYQAGVVYPNSGTTLAGTYISTMQDHSHYVSDNSYKPANTIYVPPGKTLSHGMMPSYDMSAVPTFEAPLVIQNEISGGVLDPLADHTGARDVKTAHRMGKNKFSSRKLKQQQWCC